MTKYVLHPGVIYSCTYGDRLYISSSQLARLYRVPMDECIVVGTPIPGPGFLDLKHLYPLSSGHYYDAKENK